MSNRLKSMVIFPTLIWLFMNMADVVFIYQLVVKEVKIAMVMKSFEI